MNEIAVICKSKKRRDEFVAILQHCQMDWAKIVPFSSITELCCEDNYRRFNEIYIETKPVTHEDMRKLQFTLRNGWMRCRTFDDFRKDVALQKDWNDIYDVVYSSVLPQV